MVGGDSVYERRVAQVVGFVEAPRHGLALPLDVRGTAFQTKAAEYIAAEYASAGHELRTGMEKNHEIALGLLGVPYGVAYRDGITKLRELIAGATEARAQSSPWA